MEQQMKIIADAVNEIMRQTLADRDEIERLRKALQSIAKNTCCDTCQEAAMVARKALKEKE